VIVSFVKSVVVIFALACWTVCSAQYTTQNSGGQSYHWGPITPYGPLGGGYYGGSGQEKCDGTITSVFTYSGSKPVPQAVMISRSCVVEASAWGYAPPTVPDPDNGFRDANGNSQPIITTNWQSGIIYYQLKKQGVTEQGFPIQVHEIVYPDATSPTLTRTLAPVASCPASGFISSSVSYSANARCLRITPAGVLDPWTQPKIMIGQLLSATLTLDDVAMTFPGCTFNWTANAGKPFADYVPSLAANQYIAWTPGTSSSTALYFAKPDPIVISCAANLAPFNVGTVNLSLTLASVAPVALQYQTVQFSSWHMWCRQGNTLTPYNGSVEATDFRFYDGNTNLCGLLMNAKAETPSNFVQSSDYGLLSWAQLVIAPITKKWDIYGSPITVDGDGITGLDGAFPYPNTIQYCAADGVQALNHKDTPGFPDLTAMEGHLQYNTAFSTYLFYTPPGAASKPVPLARWIWSLDGESVRQAVVPPPWQVVTDSNVTPYTSRLELFPDHPKWSYVHPY
jgi:hypothetical protein